MKTILPASYPFVNLIKVFEITALRKKLNYLNILVTGI